MLFHLSSVLPDVVEISSELVVLIDLVLCVRKREASVVLLLLMVDVALIHKATSAVV